MTLFTLSTRHVDQMAVQHVAVALALKVLCTSNLIYIYKARNHLLSIAIIIKRRYI